jgi:hypothetical protein
MRKFLSNLAVVLLCFAACGCSGGSSGVASINVEIEDYLGQKILEVKAAGETKQVKVSGPAWEATSSTAGTADNWVVPTRDAASGDLVIKATKNYSSKRREAQVVVKALEGESSETIFINQPKGKMPDEALSFKTNPTFPELSLTNSGRIQIASEPGVYKFSLQFADEIKNFKPTSTFKWFVEIPEDVTWITSEASTPQQVKKTTNEFEINVVQNTEIGWVNENGVYTVGNPRKAIVYIVCEYAGNKDARAMYELTVLQNPTSYNEDPIIDGVIDWSEQ